MKPHTHGLMPLHAPRRQTPAQAWMITFADLTSLLLCFFILFYATLTIDRANWQALVGSFAATFSPSTVAVAVVPSGQNNAITVVQVRRGVVYLDTVLRQRVSEDPVWQSLRGTEDPSENAMVYTLNPALNDMTNPAVTVAWQRLGVAVHTWQTPLAVRVVVPEGASWPEATAQAWALAQAAAQGGARLKAEVRRGTISQVQWIIYGAE